MILKYKQFLLEKFIPQPDDPITVASDKNFFNDEEILINKYNAFKVDIENIYKTYSNQMDLMNKLFNKGFIKEKTKNPKKILFKSRYLGKWAEICDKKRKINDLEKITQGNQKDVGNYDQEISNNKGNDTVTDYTKDKVSDAAKRLEQNAEKIKELETEILDLNKDLKKEFEKMEKKHKEVKARLTRSEELKKSNPAEEPPAEGADKK